MLWRHLGRLIALALYLGAFEDLSMVAGTLFMISEFHWADVQHLRLQVTLIVITIRR